MDVKIIVTVVLICFSFSEGLIFGGKPIKLPGLIPIPGVIKKCPKGYTPGKGVCGILGINMCVSGSSCKNGKCCKKISGPKPPVRCPSRHSTKGSCLKGKKCPTGYTCHLKQICCKKVVVKPPVLPVKCPRHFRQVGTCSKPSGCAPGVKCHFNKICCKYVRPSGPKPPTRCPSRHLTKGSCLKGKKCPTGYKCHFKRICCKKDEIKPPTIKKCPRRYSQVGTCSSTNRRCKQSGAHCYYDRICCKYTRPTVPKPPVRCPSRHLTKGSCLKGKKCPTGYKCHNKKICCKKAEIKVCPIRHTAVGTCTKFKRECPKGATCFRSRTCCKSNIPTGPKPPTKPPARCPSVHPSKGSCVGGKKCPTGYSCHLNKICCKKVHTTPELRCPRLQLSPPSKCIKGKCPAGSKCYFNSICCKDFKLPPRPELHCPNLEVSKINCGVKGKCPSGSFCYLNKKCCKEACPIRNKDLGPCSACKDRKENAKCINNRCCESIKFEIPIGFCPLGKKNIGPCSICKRSINAASCSGNICCEDTPKTTCGLGAADIGPCSVCKKHKRARCVKDRCCENRFQTSISSCPRHKPVLIQFCTPRRPEFECSDERPCTKGRICCSDKCQKRTCVQPVENKHPWEPFGI